MVNPKPARKPTTETKPTSSSPKQQHPSTSSTSSTSTSTSSPNNTTKHHRKVQQQKRPVKTRLPVHRSSPMEKSLRIPRLRSVAHLSTRRDKYGSFIPTTRDDPLNVTVFTVANPKMPKPGSAAPINNCPHYSLTRMAKILKPYALTPTNPPKNYRPLD